MSNPGPTKEEYDSLVYRLATLEAEFGRTRKLLEAPAKKPSWWKRYWSGVAVAALVVLLLLPGVSHALTLQQKALVGLKGVGVYVAKISPEAEHLGLTEAQIKTDVELRLRKAGVRVLTEKERFETPGMPDLAVTVTPHIKSGICIYSIHIELLELVTLAREFETWGAIWVAGYVGSVWTSNIGEIRKAVGDQVDKFINDYLAANPKK